VAGRLLSSLLFGIAVTDTRTLILAAAGVLTAGVLASYLPARRAAKFDPAWIFREEG
jgi:ABC-type lipoprotein release transport system permease subunit